MSLSLKEYGELLSKCTVINKSIKAPGLNGSNIVDFYSQFANDLLGLKIPHYRVIAFWHDYDDKHGYSVFRTNDIFNQSCIELSMQLRYLIPMENGGNWGEKGCFYGITEDMSEFEDVFEFKSFNQAYAQTGNAKTKSLNLLKYPRNVIGSLMVDNWHDGDEAHPILEVSTSDVWYTQQSPNNVKKPQVLIPNKHLTHLTLEEDMELAKPTTFFFIMKGTGKMSYKDTQALFATERCDYIMPCDVRYDLSEFFVPRVPDAGDTELHLTCFEDIDNYVLQHILQEYGRSIIES